MLACIWVVRKGKKKIHGQGKVIMIGFYLDEINHGMVNLVTKGTRVWRGRRASGGWSWAHDANHNKFEHKR
jgi:hypothetical protein